MFMMYLNEMFNNFIIKFLYHRFLVLSIFIKMKGILIELSKHKLIR